MVKVSLILLSVLIAVILLISLIAVVLSIMSYTDSNSNVIMINQLRDNISKLSIQLDKDITSVATTVEIVSANISQLFIQLDAIISKLAISMQANFTCPLHCGPGEWYCVAHLNMSNPLQQCPSAWREVTFDRIRVCARPNSTNGSCPSVVYISC